MSKYSWYISMAQDLYHFAPRALYRLLFPLHDRNSGMVQAQYDRRYAQALAAFKDHTPTLEEYIFGTNTQPEWMLVDRRIQWTTYASAYKAFLPELEKYLAPYLAQAQPTIVEYGCGNGRNLLYLKSRYPHIRCIGIELSPIGVALAREASQALGLPVEFIQADLTASATLDLSATIAYSCFSFEQMPRTFIEVAKAMAKASHGPIVLFEPVPELYPWSVRGIISRARAIVIDHVRNVLSTLKAHGFSIERAGRLGMGNPYTDATVVVAHID